MANIIKDVRDSLQFTIEELMQIGEYAKGLIRDDALQGIMQNGTSGHKYSRQYAKYKANSMRRFTSDVTRQDWADKFNGIKKDFYRLPNGKVVIKTPRYTKSGKIKKNERVSNKYYGKSLNTETAFVNMTLTRDMWNGLKVTDKTHATPTGAFIQLGFDPKDSMKIIGNAARGYVVNNLRPENQNKIAARIHKIIKDRQKRTSNA